MASSGWLAPTTTISTSTPTHPCRRFSRLQRLGINLYDMQHNYLGAAGLTEKDGFLGGTVAEAGTVGCQQQGSCLAEETR
jgi:hypothetical protein